MLGLRHKGLNLPRVGGGILWASGGTVDTRGLRPRGRKAMRVRISPRPPS